MTFFIGSILFLFVLYMAYRDVEERHLKSLRENSELLYNSQKELRQFKEYYYKLKEEYSLLQKELDNCKKAIQKFSKNDRGTFNGDELAEW